MVIIISMILFILLVLAFKGKYKSKSDAIKTVARQTNVERPNVIKVENNKTFLRKPDSSKVETANKYFGIEWENWLSLNKFNVKAELSFYETTAIALQNLNSEEHNNLLLSFLKVEPNPSPNTSTVISIGLDNYHLLHLETLNLLKKELFSESSMTELFKQLGLVRKKRIEESKIIGKENNIIKEENKNISNGNNTVNWKVNFLNTESNIIKNENDILSEENDFKFKGQEMIGGIAHDIIGKEKDDSVIDITGKAEILKTNHETEDTNQLALQQKSQYTYPDPNDFRLGKLYKSKLGLSNQEVSWLNKFWNPANVFLGLRDVA